VLYSRNLLRSGTIIGRFKLDVGTVYNTPGKLSCFCFLLYLHSLHVCVISVALYDVVVMLYSATDVIILSIISVFFIYRYLVIAYDLFTKNGLHV